MFYLLTYLLVAPSSVVKVQN